jgi:hypothetical protein
MHSKYIPTYLTMVSVKKKNVFVRLCRYSDSGAEFTTAQKVADRSAQMHSKYIPTSLSMAFVKEEYVFVRLYRPSRQASRTQERSSPLHKKYHIYSLQCIPTSLTMVFVKKKIVFLPLYRPSLQAPRTPEQSSLCIQSTRSVRTIDQKDRENAGAEVERTCVYAAKSIKYTTGSWAAKRIGMNECSYFTTQSSSQVPIVACVLTYEGC